MKVQQLIDALENLDPEAIVIVSDLTSIDEASEVKPVFVKEIPCYGRTTPELIQCPREAEGSTSAVYIS